MNSTLHIKNLHQDAIIPRRAHASDAGLDLFSIHDAALPPRTPIKIATGISMAIPEAHVGLICDRSSLGAKGIRTLGGVVDSGYRGEVQVILINLTDEPLGIRAGDKIAQILILPVLLGSVVESQELNQTTRSEQGFGSSGR